MTEDKEEYLTFLHPGEQQHREDRELCGEQVEQGEEVGEGLEPAESASITQRERERGGAREKETRERERNLTEGERERETERE